MKHIERALCTLSLALFTLAGCASLGGKAEKPVDAGRAAVTPPAKATAQETAWLTEREWTISGFNTGNQFVPLEPGHGGDAWVYFGADGALIGYTGTNNFRGTWELGAKNAKGHYPLAINLGPMTRKAATNEIAARFEMSFLENLKKSVVLAPKSSSFELLGPDGDRLLAFLFLDPERAE